MLPVDGRSAKGPGPLPETATGGNPLHGGVLPSAVSGGARGPQGALSPVQSTGQGSATSQAKSQVRKGQARKVEDGSAAIEAALDFAASSGKGDRWGALGDTGTGKTTLMQVLTDRYECRTGGAVVIVDDGGMAGYRAEERVDLGHLAREPAKGTRVALVGDPFRGQCADPEQGARVAWAIAHRRKRVALVVDELNDACRSGFWRKGVTMLPSAFTKGRKYGLSLVWTTQQVQDTPREVFNQTSVIACFRLVGLGVERLRERGYLEGMPEGTLESLPGLDAPKDQVGTFVMLWRGRPWDGRFYRLSL